MGEATQPASSDPSPPREGQGTGLGLATVSLIERHPRSACPTSGIRARLSDQMDPERLALAAHLTAVGQLAPAYVHEMNTPLAALGLRAEGLARMAEDPAVLAGRLVLEIRPWFTKPGAALPDDGALEPAGDAPA